MSGGDRQRFKAWAVVFKDGEPMHLSISRHQKASIALARDYFAESWENLKSRGMRCTQITIGTKTNVQVSRALSAPDGVGALGAELKG